MRIANLLFKTNEQRQLPIARLLAKGDPRAQRGDTLVFNEDDMTELLNEWRQQPHTWMRTDTLNELQDIHSNQTSYQKTRGAFSAMQFHLFGNKHLTQTLIRFPICSAVQPAAVLQAVAATWKHCRDTMEYQSARKQSETNPAPRLSIQLHFLEERTDIARWVQAWLDEDYHNWYQLTEDDKALKEEYDSGAIHQQIAELKNQQKPRFKGSESLLSRHLLI